MRTQRTTVGHQLTNRKLGRRFFRLRCYCFAMHEGPDQRSELWVTGVRWGVFVALVVWATVSWDKPERVIFPTIIGGLILVGSFFLKRQNS